jgi:anti-anti-sigma factor
MSTALTCTTGRRPGGELILAAVGEIDMSNADAFSAALAGAQQEAGNAAFVVDLTRVEYLDSAGLAALFPHAGHVRLLATGLLGPVLSIAGLDDLTTIQER